ncbi:hypothetical protein [Paracoccus sp. TOH]|uniref:hypothetical protein n=1 Tax=Paracoccus sp. TOH TaxID=1263728 RepID=UPI0025AF8D16|nr:hypothetical protein [Paracoccus sp. TOH]WJS83244.1 hypothetical protein NBE95_05485 [Paracoccus sp. TOH]
MKRRGSIIPALAVFSLLSASQALAWQFENITGSGAGTIKACAATHEFRNAWITLRVYGDELDIVYHHEDFAFPWGQLLGPVLINVDGVAFLGVAGSNSRRADDLLPTASTMMISPKPEEYGALFSSMKNGREMRVIFPNGDVYPVPLQGSAKALEMVSECWRIKETGPNGRNPFATPAPSNPFERPAEQPASNPFEQPA